MGSGSYQFLFKLKQSDIILEIKWTNWPWKQANSYIFLFISMYVTIFQKICILYYQGGTPDPESYFWVLDLRIRTYMEQD